MADQGYVLPCHPSCMVEDRFSVCEEYVDQFEVPQWALIRTLLQKPVESTTALEDVLSNIQYDLQFSTLRSTLLFNYPKFFTCVWPNMVTAALCLPKLFPDGVLRTLQQREDFSVSFSREQIASLLVHMFLCSLQPPVWSKFWANFGIWYNSESPPVRAYLLCLLDYFSQLDPSGRPPNPLETVQFCRRVLVQPPDWSTSSAQFCDGIFVPSTSLEPEPGCNTEVSFANRDVGFGVSGTQEEVKMAMSPEACVAMLITPTLLDNETLLIRGARQVSSCQGIGRNVTYIGPLKLHCEGDRDWNQRWIVAMDAMELDVPMMENSDAASQSVTGSDLIAELKGSLLVQELNKAYCGFSGIEPQTCGNDRDEGVAIATGHWGCGAFGGNKHAKALIQLMAAAEAKKQLIYHDISDGGDKVTPFVDELQTFVNVLVNRKVSVSQLYSVMVEAGHTQMVLDDEQTLFGVLTKLL